MEEKCASLFCKRDVKPCFYYCQECLDKYKKENELRLFLKIKLKALFGVKQKHKNVEKGGVKGNE